MVLHSVMRADGHMIIHSHDCISYDDMSILYAIIIWPSDHMIMWSYDYHVITRSYDNVSIWSHFLSFGYMISWSYEHTIGWSCAHMIIEFTTISGTHIESGIYIYRYIYIYIYISRQSIFTFNWWINWPKHNVLAV